MEYLLGLPQFVFEIMVGENEIADTCQEARNGIKKLVVVKDQKYGRQKGNDPPKTQKNDRSREQAVTQEQHTTTVHRFDFAGNKRKKTIRSFYFQREPKIRLTYLSIEQVFAVRDVPWFLAIHLIRGGSYLPQHLFRRKGRDQYLAIFRENIHYSSIFTFYHILFF